MPGQQSSDGVPSSLNTRFIWGEYEGHGWLLMNFYLIVHVTAREERSTSVSELGEDAARAPHVDTWRVQLGSKQDVRGAVPQCHNLKYYLLIWQWSVLIVHRCWVKNGLSLLNPNQLPPKWVKNKCVSKCLNSPKMNNAMKIFLGGDIFDTWENWLGLIYQPKLHQIKHV